MPIIRPSTCAGTPLSSCSGTRPIRLGQFCRTRSWFPPMPPLATITADARNSNSPTAFRDDCHTARRSRRLQHRAAHPDHGAVLDDQLVDAMAMREPHLRVTQQPAREDVDDRRAGPPGDVEARHRIAMAACVVAAALGPADDGEGLQPAFAQPAALLACGEVDVGVCPLPRPVVLGPVEARGAEPVLQRQLVAVADAQPPLFRAVDEEQATERPERLTTDVVGVLLVHDQHAAPAFDQFTGGDQTGQTGTHHDHISVSHGRQCSGPA